MGMYVHRFLFFRFDIRLGTSDISSGFDIGFGTLTLDIDIGHQTYPCLRQS
jgi:hypothetical protein